MPSLAPIFIGRPQDPRSAAAASSSAASVAAANPDARRRPAVSDVSAPSQVQPHLMPFTIAYSGPAPVGPFMVLTPATKDATLSGSSKGKKTDATASDPDDTVTDVADTTAEALPAAEPAPQTADEQCYESAFRGRGIHGTPLPLPQGWTGVVLDVPSTSAMVSASGAPAASRLNAAGAPRASPKKAQAAVKAKAIAAAPSAPVRRTSPRKASGAKVPAPAAGPPKRFAMDSDDDSDDSDADTTGKVAGTGASVPAAPALTADDIDLEADWSEASQEACGSEVDGASSGRDGQANGHSRPQREGKVMPIVGTFDRLYVWSPDGPVDKGYDPYFRALGEWQKVIVDAIHSH